MSAALAVAINPLTLKCLSGSMLPLLAASKTALLTMPTTLITSQAILPIAISLLTTGILFAHHKATCRDCNQDYWHRPTFIDRIQCFTRSNIFLANALLISTTTLVLLNRASAVQFVAKMYTALPIITLISFGVLGIGLGFAFHIATCDCNQNNDYWNRRAWSDRLRCYMHSDTFSSIMQSEAKIGALALLLQKPEYFTAAQTLTMSLVSSTYVQSAVVFASKACLLASAHALPIALSILAIGIGVLYLNYRYRLDILARLFTFSRDERAPEPFRTYFLDWVAMKANWLEMKARTRNFNLLEADNQAKQLQLDAASTRLQALAKNHNLAVEGLQMQRDRISADLHTLEDRHRQTQEELGLARELLEQSSLLASHDENIRSLHALHQKNAGDERNLSQLCLQNSVLRNDRKALEQENRRLRSLLCNLGLGHLVEINDPLDVPQGPCSDSLG